MSNFKQQNLLSEEAHNNILVIYTILAHCYLM